MQAIKGFVGLSESTETAAANTDDPLQDLCTLTTRQRFVRLFFDIFFFIHASHPLTPPYPLIIFFFYH